VTDPGTSHQAAASVRVSTTAVVRGRILDLLRTYGPMCDDDIATRYRATYSEPATDSGLRTRRKELVTEGAVDDSGGLALTSSGRPTIVWAAAETAQAAA